MNADPISEAKAQIATILSKIITFERNINETIDLLGLEPPRARELLSAHGDSFTMDEQFRFLNQIGFDVVITLLPVPPTEQRLGRIRVATAAEMQS